MWDIETFTVPVLAILQPGAADSLLDYRFRMIEAARRNAHLMGRRGLQFAWESAPKSGDEAARLPGTAAWHEDHVSLDVARAFANVAEIKGDTAFLREKAWPVLSGVASWIKSRAAKGRPGYVVRESMGIAERRQPVQNAAFTNMACVVVLGDAIRAGEKLSIDSDPDRRHMAENMSLPRRGKAIVSHDGYKKGEEKGATPDPLMGIWPFGFPIAPEEEEATIKFYLEQADDYLGIPMLSALYGVWAARLNDRQLALRLIDEGYGQFTSGRFSQTLEYWTDKFPEQPRAGPFFENMGGFLMSLLFGFTGLKPNYGDVETWNERPVLLPDGWRAIEVDRVWIRGKPTRLTARQGQVAKLEKI